MKRLKEEDKSKGRLIEMLLRAAGHAFLWLQIGHHLILSAIEVETLSQRTLAGV